VSAETALVTGATAGNPSPWVLDPRTNGAGGHLLVVDNRPGD